MFQLIFADKSCRQTGSLPFCTNFVYGLNLALEMQKYVHRSRAAYIHSINVYKLQNINLLKCY